MSLKLIASISFVSFGAAVAHLAAATPPARTDHRLAAIAVRQADMKRMREPTSAILDFVKGEHSDVALLRRSAATVQQVAGRMNRLWPAGTGVGVGTSKSRSEIWTEGTAFQRRIAGFQGAAANMARAAATGDKAEVRQQLIAIGAACKSCHDFFRVPH